MAEMEGLNDLIKVIARIRDAEDAQLQRLQEMKKEKQKKRTIAHWRIPPLAERTPPKTKAKKTIRVDTTRKCKDQNTIVILSILSLRILSLRILNLRILSLRILNLRIRSLLRLSL